MASESTEEEVVSVALPPDLRRWLDQRASQLDVDRQEMLVQLVSTYRATVDGDGDAPAVVETRVVEEQFESLADELRTHVQEQVDDVATSGEVADLSDDVQEKIEDVRERVLQVKRETDGKAPNNHGHVEFEELRDELRDLETALSTVESKVNAEIRAHDEDVDRLDERIDAMDQRLEDAEEKLQTVAWIVRDLREQEDYQNKRGASLDAIKRAAAAEGIDQATCDTCGDDVFIGLLTEARCPHCEATVTDVQPAAGFFSDPTLVAASAIEAADDGEDE
jgi:DNA repair exonuclease SbcCD ATPase subunit